MNFGINHICRMPYIATLCLLFLCGCTRSDMFLVSNHNDEEIVITKMNVENVTPADFTVSKLNGVVKPWRGGLAIVSAYTAKLDPNVEIEWTHKNTRYSSMCSYQKSRSSCEVEVAIFQAAIYCGRCDVPFP